MIYDTVWRRATMLFPSAKYAITTVHPTTTELITARQRIRRTNGHRRVETFVRVIKTWRWQARRHKEQQTNRRRTTTNANNDGASRAACTEACHAISQAQAFRVAKHTRTNPAGPATDCGICTRSRRTQDYRTDSFSAKSHRRTTPSTTTTTNTTPNRQDGRSTGR